MKHIKTVAMSLLLANSFSSNEVTWKEIEAELKPHIEEVESDFSALEKEIKKIHEDYRASQGDTEFNNLEAEAIETRRKSGTKEDKREKKKKLIEEKKQYYEEYKKEKKEKIEKIKNNITNIIEKRNNEIQIDKETIELNEINNIDIEKIKKDLTAIKNMNEKMLKINTLKTFAELQEFTKEFKYAEYLKKTYNHKYLYDIAYTAITKKIAVPFLNIIKAEERKKEDTEKIASSLYSYETALEKFIITDENYHNAVLKNVFNEEKIKKQEEALKEKYKRSLDITVFAALSNKQDKQTLEEHAPAILTMLETLKGTEEENKKITVRQAIEIFKNFISQANNNTVLDKNEIREAKKKNQQSNFDSKKKERIEKLKKEIEKLETDKSKLDTENTSKLLALLNQLEPTSSQVKNKLWTIASTGATNREAFDELDTLIKSTSDKNNKKKAREIEAMLKERPEKLKDILIIEKEIDALQKTIDKITQEEYKEKKYNDEATNNQEKSSAKKSQTRAKLAEKKIEAKGQAKKEMAEEKSNEKQKQGNKKTKIIAPIKSTGSLTALKKGKTVGKVTEPNFNTIDESDTKEKREKEALRQKAEKNYKTYDNKESSGSNILTKEEFDLAKKGKRNKEV